jgi:methionine transaminase
MTSTALHIPPSKLPRVGTTIFTVMSGLAAKHNAINLSQGFPNWNPDPRLQDLVTEYMQKGLNQYAPMPGLPVLRERIAHKMNTLYGTDIHPDTEVTVTAGATQAIFCSIAAFIHPGDEVVLIEPCYDSYRPSIETVGGVPVIHTLSAPDYAIDWAEVAAKFTPRTRMICVNNPVNPTGRILSQADLNALADILRDTNILLMSDEVYEHLTFDGQPHIPAFTHPDLRERTLASYSFGKTYHNTGWKVGYCIAPEALMVEFRKVHQFNVFSVNTPVQAAFADFMADADTYTTLPGFYQQKRDFFRELMAPTRFRALPSSGAGTYFQLYDYSAISDEPDADFCCRLAIEHGVAAIPVSAFFSEPPGGQIIRFCFAKTDEVLAEGAERLRKV